MLSLHILYSLSDLIIWISFGIFLTIKAGSLEKKETRTEKKILYLFISLIIIFLTVLNNGVEDYSLAFKDTYYIFSLNLIGIMFSSEKFRDNLINKLIKSIILLIRQFNFNLTLLKKGGDLTR